MRSLLISLVEVRGFGIAVALRLVLPGVCLATLTSSNAMSQGSLVGNEIVEIPQYGFALDVFDSRPATLEFMDERGLQAGGATWKALIQAALEVDSLNTAAPIDLQDESDVVRVISTDRGSLEQVQALVTRLLNETEFRDRCLRRARSGGYLE